MNEMLDYPDHLDRPDGPETLPPYPPSLPPPLSGAAFAPLPWQPFTRETRPAWLPPALARPPLTAQLVIAAAVQFVAAALALLVAVGVLLFSAGIATIDATATLSLLIAAIPVILFAAHLACGLLALARKQWAAWTGYALLVVEAFIFVALTV